MNSLLPLGIKYVVQTFPLDSRQSVVGLGVGALCSNTTAGPQGRCTTPGDAVSPTFWHIRRLASLVGLTSAIILVKVPCNIVEFAAAKAALPYPLLASASAISTPTFASCTITGDSFSSLLIMCGAYVITPINTSSLRTLNQILLPSTLLIVVAFGVSSIVLPCLAMRTRLACWNCQNSSSPGSSVICRRISPLMPVGISGDRECSDVAGLLPDSSADINGVNSLSADWSMAEKL
jgi:hypothetical protein